MRSCVGDIPVLDYKRVLDWMEAYNLLEEVVAICSLNSIIEVGKRRSSSTICQSSIHELIQSTYGQDMIDTTAIPMTIASLTLKAMRYAVRTPPQRTPIHNYVGD